jgi:Leucine-rich repeat (LRR) protein
VSSNQLDEFPATELQVLSCLQTLRLSNNIKMGEVFNVSGFAFARNNPLRELAMAGVDLKIFLETKKRLDRYASFHSFAPLTQPVLRRSLPLVPKVLRGERSVSLASSLAQIKADIPFWAQLETSTTWQPLATFWRSLERVESIDFSRCNLTQVPMELFECLHLRRLSIHTNAITELPREIARLSLCLRELDVHDNKLTELPVEIGLFDLTLLNIKGNPISALPVQLGALSSLDTPRDTGLKSSRNANVGSRTYSGDHLRTQKSKKGKAGPSNAPRSMSGAGLRDEEEPKSGLILDANNITFPPSEITNQGTRQILSFLQQAFQGKEKNYTMKLVLVGLENVG